MTSYSNLFQTYAESEYRPIIIKVHCWYLGYRSLFKTVVLFYIFNKMRNKMKDYYPIRHRILYSIHLMLIHNYKFVN